MSLNRRQIKLKEALVITGLFSSLSLGACTPSSHKNSSEELLNNPTGIINGSTEIDVGIEASLVAVLDEEEGELCTGTLIGKNLVLTAAHCVGNDLSKVFILFGKELDVDSPRRSVDKVEVSPYWKSRQNLQNDIGDIALLHFTGKRPDGYRSATLLNAIFKDQLAPGINVLIAGYGLAVANDEYSAGVLRQTTVTVENPVYGASEVLLNQTAGSGACHGDSGGPAFVQVNGKYYLWGVTSRGIEDDADKCDQFAAYSSTLYYRAWIVRMSEKLSKSLVSQDLCD